MKSKVMVTALVHGASGDPGQFFSRRGEEKSVSQKESAAARRVLEKDGVIRILTPDLYRIAKAYVTKDVDDYCIVGGVPARPIKKRFSEDTIAKLLAIKWWKYDSKKINSVINILENDIDEFLKIQNFESKK